MIPGILAFFWPGLLFAEAKTDESLPAAPEVEFANIASINSAFPVGFCLLTHGNKQYVAYYDAGHQMTVASRMLNSNEWQYQILPSKVGWDSHNYITMAIDNAGQIHLSGNMHASPLIYFRTSKPGDISSFERIATMTGENETSMTYPKFLRGADGALIFHYRSGGSGHGNEIYNIYDTGTKTWKRLLAQPLTDGKGKRNAYAAGPFRGPDGLFHMAWVWRESADCSSNHAPSYARSRDLIQWETIDGKPVPLPITIESKETLIDPVPVNGGLINGNLSIGFDSRNQVVAAYHKFDSNGKTQAYAARFENGKWTPHLLTRWDYRWEFQKTGTVSFELILGSIRPYGPGKLALPYEHRQYGKGLLVIDEKTLEPLGTDTRFTEYPAELSRPESSFPGMKVNWAADEGSSDNPDIHYALRWETLTSNRDKKPDGPLPEPGMLKIYKLKSQPPNP